MGNAMTQPRHGPQNLTVEYLQFAVLVLLFATAAVCLHLVQWLGIPLGWWNRQWYDACQGFVKRSTALLVLGLNQWRAPVTAEISCDSSVAGQVRKASNGKTVFDFPDRMVLIANHQLYTDWLSLWWTAYTSGRHEGLIIVLKDAIRKIPILGPGMAFFNWIFLSRRWEADGPQLQRSISQLSDPTKCNPMWLLIFPEGTNISKRSMAISEKWAEKSGLAQFKHVLLPRSRGLQLILAGLTDSVEWLYDCTIAYEDIPPGTDGQDVFNLRSLYIEGRKAPVTHLHWRRFAIKEMPLDDSAAFDKWLYERWAEKEELLKQFQSHGRFPTADDYVHARVELNSLAEILPILPALLAIPVSWWLMKCAYKLVVGLCAVVLRA